MLHRHFLQLALLVAIGLAPAAAPAQTVYAWLGITSDFAAQGNWIPTRMTPATDDILVFNGGGTATVTNVTAQTIGEFHIQGNTSVNLSVPAARTLTVAGGSAPVDFVVQPGCTLTYSGGFALTIALGPSAVGAVDGNVVFTSTGNTIPHRLTAVNQGGTVEGLSFNSGSTFQFAPGGSGAGNPFGTAALNSVRFKSGSTFYQGGTTSGPSVGTGSNPFGATAPNSVLIMDAGSTFYNWTSVLSAAGRTYGHYVQDNRGAAVAPGGSTTWVVQGDFTVKSTSIGNTQFDGTANPLLRVDGNLTVEAGGRLNDATGGVDPTSGESAVHVKGNVTLNGPQVSMQPNGIRPWVLNGTTQQQVTLSSDVAFNGLRVDNPAGARLMSNVAANGVLNLANGVVDTNGFTLTAADGAANLLRTSGFVAGTLARAIGASTGARSFPVGTAGQYSPVDVDLTVAPAAPGTLAVTATAADHPGSNDPTLSINRYWTLSPTGLAGFTADLTFHYLDADLGAVNEATLVAGRSLGGFNWQVFTPTLDTVANTAKATGVTAFSDWTLGDPAAVPVAVSAFSID